MNSNGHHNDVTLLDRTRKALDEIRPYLNSDGGDVELTGIDHGVAKVRLTGHCSNCPMSSQTLKAGIEKLLCARIPEIVAVEQDRTHGQTAVASGIAAPKATEHSHRATAALREDHDRIRLNLKQLEAALQSVATTWPVVRRIEMDTIRRTHSFLATTFVEHMKLEEEILFPELQPFVDWGRPTAVLDDEHHELRSGIEAMDKAILKLEFGGPASLIGVAGQLCQKIRDHLFREENTVFFEADAVLDDAAVWLLNQRERKSCTALASS